MRRGLRWTLVLLGLATVLAATTALFIRNALDSAERGRSGVQPPDNNGAADPGLPPREDRVTEANFDRIESSMSLADVEVILGPPGEYSTGPLFFGPRTSLLFSSLGPHPTGGYKPPNRENFFGDGLVDVVEWRTDKQMITVYFLPSGGIRGKECHDVVRVAR